MHITRLVGEDDEALMQRAAAACSADCSGRQPILFQMHDTMENHGGLIFPKPMEDDEWERMAIAQQAELIRQAASLM